MPARQNPDTISHLLATNEGSPARFYLVDGQATVPVTPYRNSGVETTTVPLSHFDAVIETVHIEDGGLTLTSVYGIHLPESEWRRIGLEKHWHADDVDLRSPVQSPTRRLELFASREHARYSSDDPDDRDPHAAHLTDVPDDSPLITEWADGTPDDIPDRPPVPFDRPTLSVQVLWAEDASDPQGLDRVELGQIARVDIRDTIDEWPTDPDIDPREVDLSPPPLHPHIEYESLEPLAQTDAILTAVRTINRYAKQFDEEADTAYEMTEGAEARAYSIRKRALYRSKTVAVHRLVKADPEAVDLVRHSLDGNHELLCVYLSAEDGTGYSFHQPFDAVEADLLEAVVGHDDPAQLRHETISFEPATETDALESSLADAIATLRRQGIEPNDYLDAETVEDYDWGYEISTTF